MSILLSIFTGPARRLSLVAILAGIFVWGAPIGALGYQNVELTWNPSSNGDVIGYNVYYGTESGSYTARLTVDNVMHAQINGLADGRTYYFAVSATDSAGNESVLSKEVSYTVPRPPPVTLSAQIDEVSATVPLPPPVTLSAQIFPEAAGQPAYMIVKTTDSVIGWWEIDYSSDLRNWNLYSFGYGNIGLHGNGVSVRVPLDPAQPRMFFRLAKF